MSNLLGTNIISPILPFSTQDVFATHLAEFGKGGFRTVLDLNERDSIKELRRENLMMVAVEDDSYNSSSAGVGFYILDVNHQNSSSGLITDNNNWTKLNLGSDEWILPPPPQSFYIGQAGQRSFDEDFLYVCISENIWKRVAYDFFVDGSGTTSGTSGGLNLPQGSVPIWDENLNTFGYDLVVKDLENGVDGTTSGINVIFSDDTNKFIEIIGGSGDITWTMPPPLTTTSSGIRGEVSFDDNFYYLCVQDNMWKRINVDYFAFSGTTSGQSTLNFDHGIIPVWNNNSKLFEYDKIAVNEIEATVGGINVINTDGTIDYIPFEASTSGSSGVYLDSLGDVTITAPLNDQILVYDNGMWTNKFQNDYTTAGLATTNYVDSGDNNLQVQIDNLDIKDHTTAGYLTSVDASNTYTTINDFNNTTSGINNELDSLDNRIDILEADSIHSPDYTTAGLATTNYVDSGDSNLQLQIDNLDIKDHTTAGYSTQTYVDNTFTTINEFNNATSGINNELDNLQFQIDNLDTTSGTTTNILNDLLDVTVVNPLVDDVLQYSGSNWVNNSLDINDHTTAGYSTQTYVDNTFTTIIEFNNATSGINNRLDVLESNSIHSPDYTTAGLATTNYVDSGDSNLQLQIDNLDIKDHTTAGYLTSVEASNTYTTINDFNNATSGINNELDNLQFQIDTLPQGNDHTTAGYSTQTYVDSTFTTITDFNNATSGINNELNNVDSRLDVLEANSIHSPNYTTAGLATINYVDSGDLNLQNQIDNLDIKDHTTAGYLTSVEASNTYTTITNFNNATSGINDELYDLQLQIDNLPVSNDYTTAGLSTVTYVDSGDNNLQLQIDNLDIKDHTTAGYSTQTYVDSTFTTLVEFNNATSGINQRLDELSSIDTLKTPDVFSPNGSYPTTYYGDPIEQGDTWRISSNGTMGTVVVNIEDLLISLVDLPLQLDSNFMVIESNRDQATEQFMGVAKLATTSQIIIGTNDTNIVTPLKLQQKIDSIPQGNDYTTAGLATVTYVDSGDNNLQLQIDNLDIKDHTTAGYLTSSEAFNTYTSINDFDNATSGINDELDNVDSRLDILESNSIHSPDYTTAGLATVTYVDSGDNNLQLQIDNLDIKDHTTAGYATQTYVDNTFVTITEFDNATSGINNELDNLQIQIDTLPVSNDYTTAGLSTVTYVDSGDLNLQNQIDNLDIKDHTTAGYSTQTYVDSTFVTVIEFDNSTNGINNELDSIDSRLDILEADSIHSPDYTTAGLATINYVDSADSNLQLQIDNLDIKDHTTAGYIKELLDDNNPTLANKLNVNDNEIYNNGDLSLNSSSGNVIINNLKYPNSDGSNGDVLSTDGNGNLEFVSINNNIYTALDSVNINSNGLVLNPTTLISPTSNGSNIIDANILKIGDNIKIKMYGYINVSTTGSFGFDVQLGGTSLASTNNVTISKTKIDALVDIEFILSVREIGISGSVIGQGYVKISGGVGASIPSSIQLVNITTSTINTTISNSLDFLINWDTNFVGDFNITNTIIEK